MESGGKPRALQKLARYSGRGVGFESIWDLVSPWMDLMVSRALVTAAVLMEMSFEHRRQAC
jgi:hypothetical protein